MSSQRAQEARPISPSLSVRGRRVLQRKCECGAHIPGGGACKSCAGKTGVLQRKLSIGSANDPLEDEADRVAAQVLAAPMLAGAAPAPFRIQRFAPPASGRSEAAPASVDRALASSGRPLDAASRQDMEQRFSHDFSQVRVHQDDIAAQSARDIGARAYTIGHDIVFGPGGFAPATAAGRQLLAHELTHVVQQSGGASGPLLQRQWLGGGAPGKEEAAALTWESFRQSITVADFDSDKATLKPEHVVRLKEYKERFHVLLGRYPDSFVSVVGHTDATDSDAHNQALGQQRADAVKAELTSGDFALPASIVSAASLGETAPAVEAPGREARNRRVEIHPTLRQSFRLPPPPPPGTGKGTQGPTTGPVAEPSTPDRTKPIPKFVLPQKDWLKEGLEDDPLLRGLPEALRRRVIDAAKDGDEKLAEKAIDLLPLGDKKAAIQALVKALLQAAKGKKFQRPEQPSRWPDFPPRPGFPEAPGEHLFPLGKFTF